MSGSLAKPCSAPACLSSRSRALRTRAVSPRGVPLSNFNCTAPPSSDDSASPSCSTRLGDFRCSSPAAKVSRSTPSAWATKAACSASSRAGPRRLLRATSSSQCSLSVTSSALAACGEGATGASAMRATGCGGGTAGGACGCGCGRDAGSARAARACSAAAVGVLMREGAGAVAACDADGAVRGIDGCTPASAGRKASIRSRLISKPERGLGA